MITPNNIHQVEELILKATESVKANEPGTLRYHLQRELEGDAPTFVMLET
jgi:quinol monooxygenase YgiN